LNFSASISETLAQETIKKCAVGFRQEVENYIARQDVAWKTTLLGKMWRERIGEERNKTMLIIKSYLFQCFSMRFTERFHNS
jgi:hypothetical protein